MRAGKLISIVLFIFSVCAQENADNEKPKLIELCSVCTCSELTVFTDNNEFYLNIMCSELDKIVKIPDLDKIKWPENTNKLKVSATFDGLGLSTLGK